MEILTVTPTPISDGSFWSHFGTPAEGGLAVGSQTSVFDRTLKKLFLSGVITGGGDDVQSYITIAHSGRSTPPNTRNYVLPEQLAIDPAEFSIPDYGFGQSVQPTIYAVASNGLWELYNLTTTYIN